MGDIYIFKVNFKIICLWLFFFFFQFNQCLIWFVIRGVFSSVLIWLIHELRYNILSIYLQSSKINSKEGRDWYLLFYMVGHSIYSVLNLKDQFHVTHFGNPDVKWLSHLWSILKRVAFHNWRIYWFRDKRN